MSTVVEFLEPSEKLMENFFERDYEASDMTMSKKWRSEHFRQSRPASALKNFKNENFIPLIIS